MKNPKIIAILTADWHLQHKPPIWRSNEPDWYDAMTRPLGEISALQIEYKCPVIVAGDIFTKWNSPPELINFAIKNMPEEVYAIPGQHDLPNHNYQEIDRSAYNVLNRTGIVKDIPWRTEDIEDDEYELVHNDMIVSGFSFGLPITRAPEEKNILKVAVVHDYVWCGNHKHPNAPEEKRVERRSNKMINGKLYGYDVIVYGDNHKGFSTTVGKTRIWNCGTLMRRTSDEEDYKPRVGLLYSDGHIEPHYLDISKDKHLTKEEAEQFKSTEEIDTAEFAKELRKLGDSASDFVEAMKQFWGSNKTKKAIQNIILKAMENDK